MNNTNTKAQELVRKFVANNFKKGLTGPEILKLANSEGLVSPRTKKPLTMGIIYRINRETAFTAKRAPAKVAASKKAAPLKKKAAKATGKRKTKKK